MTLEKIVIIGAGQGGLQMAAFLRQDGYEGALTLIGDETSLPYQRPPLSKIYLKTGDASKINLRPQEFFEQHNIELMTGTRITKINREAKTISTDIGSEISYDHLILATGSRNRIPPIEGLNAKGVYSIRTDVDTDRLRAEMAHGKHAIVIGGGFIGLEFAAVARAAGLEVTVLEGANRLMARAVSEPISQSFLAFHEQIGVDVRLGNFVDAVLSNSEDHVSGVRLASGEIVEGDMVIVAAGVIPNQELAAEAGLKISNGVEVDATLLTSDSSISALGDCCLFPEPLTGKMFRLESVQAATDHARLIAKRLTGTEGTYAAIPWFWSDQGDRKLQIAGMVSEADEIMCYAPSEGKTVSCGFRNGTLISVETINSAVEHMSARKAMNAGIPITKQAFEDAGRNLPALIKALTAV